MIMNRNELIIKLKSIIKLTERVSYPFMIKKNEKEKYMLDERIRIDKLIDDSLQNYSVKVDIENEKNAIWEESKEKALSEFSDLPERLKDNSFYLQEVLHNYTERIVNRIIEILNTKEAE